MNNRNIAILALLGATVLFGLMSIPSKSLANAGLGPFDVTFLRLAISTIVLFFYLLIRKRDKLTVRRQDLVFLILFGVFKYLADYMFFEALGHITVGLVSILQNTFPYFVLFASFILFKERVEKRKILFIMIGSFGCVLMAGNALASASLNPLGILFSLLSAVCLAMYIIGARISLDRGYEPVTYLFYMMLVASIIAAPLCNLPHIAETITANPTAILDSFILAVFMTVIPFFIMAWSLKYLEPVITSMITVMELVFASLVGLWFFNEPLNLQDIIGIVLMCLSIYLMNKAYTEKEDDMDGGGAEPTAPQ